MIEQQIKKQMKLAARKQLYFALAMLVEHQGEQIRRFREAAKALEAERERAEEALPEGISVDDAVKTMNMESLPHIVAAQRVFTALRNYAQAFGELPEFVRFLNEGALGANQEKILAGLDELNTIFAGISKKIGKHNGKTLMDFTFGEDFQRKCEQIKLKGEV